MGVSKRAAARPIKAKVRRMAAVSHAPRLMGVGWYSAMAMPAAIRAAARNPNWGMPYMKMKGR